MGVKAEDLLMYSQVEVSGLQLHSHKPACPWAFCKEAFMTGYNSWESLLLQDDIPFAHQVAKFPVKKRPKLPPSFAAKKEVTTMRTQGSLPADKTSACYALPIKPCLQWVI